MCYGRRMRRGESEWPAEETKMLKDILVRKEFKARKAARKGGLIGGKRLAAAMTQEQRTARAKKAANVRWKKGRRRSNGIPQSKGAGGTIRMRFAEGADLCHWCIRLTGHTRRFHNRLVYQLSTGKDKPSDAFTDLADALDMLVYAGLAKKTSSTEARALKKLMIAELEKLDALTDARASGREREKRKP